MQDLFRFVLPVASLPAIQTVGNEPKDFWTRIEDLVAASEGSVHPRPVFVAISEPEIFTSTV